MGVRLLVKVTIGVMEGIAAMVGTSQCILVVSRPPPRGQTDIVAKVARRVPNMQNKGVVGRK